MSNPRHTFEITVAPAGVGSRVAMDGQELKGVWSVAVEAACDDVSKVTVTFIAQDVRITGEAGLVTFATRAHEVRQ